MQPIKEINFIHKGVVAEQVVGQLLRASFPFYIDPVLYYWLREGPNANSEIDYLITHHDKIIPIEVKAGKTGTLKSLHYFMANKGYHLAIRINSDTAHQSEVRVKDTTGKPVTYHLLSLPFYLLGQLPRLLNEFALIIKKSSMA